MIYYSFIYFCIALFNLYYLLSFIQQWHYHYESIIHLFKRIFKIPFYYLLLTPLISLLPYRENYYILLIGILIILIFYVIFRMQEKNILKLKFTKRIKRLIVINLLIYIIHFIFITRFLTEEKNTPDLFILYCSIIYLYLSLLISEPIEKLIQIYYAKKAKKKIERINPLIIGITGSAGKTSTKNFLYQMLQNKYITFMTPESYNTLNGIAISINNQMIEGTEIAIIEYGASHKGDIKKSLKYFKPNISIITNIYPQHLETFKTMENIINEKTLLMKDSQTHIYNVNSVYNINSVCNKIDKEVITYGLSEEADYYPIDCKCTNKGLEFICKTKEESFKIKTKLYGKINILNLLSVICVCKKVGLTSKEISLNMRKLVPMKSRLELIEINGKKIINDSFNSNKVGFLEALETLKLFPEERIIITPGIVTGGALLSEINEEVAKEITKSASSAYIVQSTVSKYLTKVFDEKFFEYHLYKSFNEAYEEAMRSSAKTILIENDITDIYKG